MYIMCRYLKHIVTNSVRTVIYVSQCFTQYYIIISYCTACVAMCSTLLQNQYVLYSMCRYMSHIIKKSVRTLLYVSLSVAHYYKISSYCTLCDAMCSTELQNHLVQYCMCRYL
jgi:hypothetical protein